MTELLFPCTNTLQTPNPPFWTTKTAIPKFPQNGGSTPTPVLRQGRACARGGGVRTRRVRRTIKSSKIAGRTGAFVGHAVRCLTDELIELGTQRAQAPKKNTVRTQVFGGRGVRWPSIDDGRHPPESLGHSHSTSSITRRSCDTHCPCSSATCRQVLLGHARGGVGTRPRYRRGGGLHRGFCARENSAPGLFRTWPEN